MSAVIGLALPLGLLLLWQVASYAPSFPIDTVSRPLDIGAALLAAAEDGSLLMATGQTLLATLTGLAIAIAVGVPFGFAVGYSRRIEGLTDLLVETIRPIPAVALIPLALLVMGFGVSMEASLVGFAAFWPIMIMSRTGMREIDPRLLEVADALGFGTARRFAKFMLPGAMRQLFTALRLGSGVALVVAVTVEIAVNPYGLGYQLVGAQVALRPDRMFAFLVWIAFVGWALTAIISLFEARLFAWDVQVAS